MSSSDRLPDYPLSSGVSRRLRSALEAGDEQALGDVLCRQVGPVDAVIELANDDWMKDPAAPLPPGVLVGEPCQVSGTAMERWPEPVGGKLQTSGRMDKGPHAADESLVRELHAALLAGDLRLLAPLADRLLLGADTVLELREEEMEWQGTTPATFGLSGLWTLEYKRELTTPLCIAAARGHEACVGHLLGRGANPDASPGGRGPLHEACLGGHTACAELLLRHHADPDLLSAKGLAPLHLCRTAASLGCAQALLEHGASVHCAGGTSQDTPLHVAAQHGLDEHARLYLDRGARVDARNGQGETALSAACGVALRPEEHERGARLCALLLQRGAAPDARDEDERSPLHKACSRVRPDLVHLLLRHGADATALDYGGASPLGRVLQAASCAPQAEPERIVQELLNHGSPTVWPDAFPKVLKSCASAPAVLEVLFNSYPQLCVPQSWRGEIPEEAFQAHRPFYQSLFALASSPRRLKHLCRCAIRRRLGRGCSGLVPRLPLPASLQGYLLLEPERVLH